MDGPAEDRELTSRAQAGDVEAFVSLVERYRDRVYGLAFRMTRSEADAADITQETFLSAFQHLGEFRGEAAFGSWVHRIAANHSLMRLRKSRAAESEQEPAGPKFNERGSHEEYPERDWSRGVEERALEKELGAAIQQAIDRLPSGYREVFLLRDIDGLSYEEIAELIGVSVPAIKSRLHRARLALRDAIDKFYNES